MNFTLHPNARLSAPHTARAHKLTYWGTLATTPAEPWRLSLYWHVVLQICVLLLTV